MWTSKNRGRYDRSALRACMGLPSHVLAETSVSAQMCLTRGTRVGISGRMVTDAHGCNGCTVGSEHWRGSLSDRILIAENRCTALFVSTVSPDSETAALQCGRPVDRATVHPPGYMAQGPPFVPDAPAPSSLQKIRLSSDGANQLNGSRNWQADGDGSSVCTLIRMSRGGGLKGVTGSQLAPACRKALRHFLRFTRGTGSPQRPGAGRPRASPSEDR